MSESNKIQCCIEAPDSFLPKARYVLEMLLLPLGLSPVWIRRDELDAQSLFYGEQKPEKGLWMRLDRRTLDFFEQEQPLMEWKWLECANHPICPRIPFLFGDETHPDWIASAFFWLSDWQSSFIHARDVHGRFCYADSVQKQLGLPPLPFVDLYCEQWATTLQEAGVPIKRRIFGAYKSAFCVTHDIDHLRKWSLGRIWIEKAWTKIGSKHDGYAEGLTRLIEEDEKNGIQATYFLKTNAHAPEDEFYDSTSAFVKEYVHKLQALGHEIGLHPSYYAHNHTAYFEDETARMKVLAQKPVPCVRQHYLRYDPQHTPLLHEKNFQIDSTLGFVDYEGFRNGTTMPFKVFHIPSNQALDLWEICLALHDTTLFQYRGLSLEKALAETQSTIRTVQYFGGICVALWHNVIYDEDEYPQWARHYEQTLVIVKQEDMLKETLSDSLGKWLLD